MIKVPLSERAGGGMNLDGLSVWAAAKLPQRDGIISLIFPEDLLVQMKVPDAVRS